MDEILCSWVTGMETVEGWRKILKERDEAAVDLEAPVLQVVQFSLRLSATVEIKYKTMVNHQMF